MPMNTQDQNNPDLTSGEFSVDHPQMATSSIPNSNPITQTPDSIALEAYRNTGGGGGGGSSGSSGAAGIGKAIGSIGGSIIGGPIGGAIGGALGDIFGGLFKEGGMVTAANKNGYAEGGEVDRAPFSDHAVGVQRQEYLKNHPPQDADMVPTAPDNEATQQQQPSPHNDPLALGYLVGAWHQAKYGGSPDTLTKAANDIKAKMQQGQGQQFNSETLRAEVARSRMQQLGHDPSAYDPVLSDDTDTGNPDSYKAKMQDYAHKYGYTNKEAPLPKGYAGGGEATDSSDAHLARDAVLESLGLRPKSEDATPNMQNNQISTNTANAMMSQPQAPQGYAQKLAMGGPPNGDPSDGPPPLQAGQQFQGDGSVKGPGGPTDDAIPARLSNGEFVMSQPAVQFFGVDKLNKMNEQGKQGFMQAMHQVQANQPQGPQGQPQGAPPGMPPGQPAQPPPMMQAKGGVSATNPTMRNKTHGYMGI